MDTEPKRDVRIFQPAKEYIRSVSERDQGAIAADIQTMASGELESVYTKQLRGVIRELIVGDHRLTYFGLGRLLCFVRGFMKKTGKTPKKEIEFAEKVHKMVKMEVQKTTRSDKKTKK